MMGSKKKDLEIIYSLQWKNKSTNGGDKANIIGMYDIPTTTLNWETFKSYLLKNSGTVGDDVKVSYITSSNREFPIESQTDFQIALYAFRRKARMGDIVTLKLDRISDQQNYRNTRHSNDVETQFDNEAASIVSSCCNSETPPEWFLTFMNKFKKNLTDEITASVANIVSNIKPHTVSQPSCYHSRKSKADNSKRRKLPLLTGEGSHESTKDLLKSLKLEGKLEHKLEKLESKTKKLKEKKLALFSKSSDSDGCSSSIKRRSSVPCEPEEDGFHMDAMPINVQQIIPHLLGGEIYLHQWKVLNSGKCAWTNETNLLYTWGAKALQPLETIISVPHLKAGERGTLAVRLQVPNSPGQYECYFSFHHRGRRFGHSLGCQIIVDPFDLKGNKSVLDTAYLNPVTCYENIWQGTSVASNACSSSFNQSNQTKDDKTTEILPENKPEFIDLQSETSNIYVDKIVRDITSRVEDIKLQDPTDTNCSSDSDNQSIISLPESNDSKGLPSEYVVVPIPDCFKVDESLNTKKVEITAPIEQQETTMPTSTPKSETSVENFDDNNNEDTNEQKDNGKNDDTASNTSHKSDIVMVSIPETNQDSEEYACVIVDGQKVMIPKKIIKSEYLQPNTAEGADKTTEENLASSNVSAKETSPEPQIIKVENNVEVNGAEDVRNNFEETEFNSHCSAAGSCFSETTAERNNRLFVFPPACPGYEVIRDEDFVNLDDEDNYTWAKSDTHYAYSVHGMKEPLKPEIVPATEAINIPQPSTGNPFVAPTISHVPNFQQTPPEERKCPTEENVRAAFEATIDPPELGTEVPPPEAHRDSTPERPSNEDVTATAPPHSPHVVHILPEGLVNVARSVINRIVPQGSPGRWENGHWVSTNPDSPREANLQALAEMGFWNRDLNASLLARYNDDLSRVVAELVQ